MFCHFITFAHPAAAVALAVEDRDLLSARLKAIPLLKRAQLLSPAVARDRYIDDGSGPMLTVQLYFEHLEALELASRAGGALLALARMLPSRLQVTRITQQVMWTRLYPTPPVPAIVNASTRASCFLVHYPGEAEDLNAWHNYYLDHHPPLMAQFPAIREIEIYTRVDWRDSLPWPRVHHFQRNRIAFDSAAALERALNSPVRDRMKRDREHFPPFTGGNVHHAMSVETLVGPLFRTF